jgi:hypothetical protein
MYRQPTQAEIELLTLRFGEVRADELARILVCSRCPLATDCAWAFCPDRDSKSKVPGGCLATAPAPPGPSFAYAA